MTIARRLAIALWLLTGPGVAQAVTVMEYHGVLHGDPPLAQPASVFVDPVSLDVCVTDEGARAVDVFDASGFHRFRSDATSAIVAPRGACIDANGDFVLTDAIPGQGEARTIRRLNFLGEPMEYTPVPPREAWIPRQLSLTRDGHYLTVDRSGLLARHDDRGELIWSAQIAEADWEGVDLLGPPLELADGTILVAGASLGRVIRVSSDGQSRSAFGVPGGKRGELAFPVDVAAGPDGTLLVLDRMRHTVLIYDADFKFQSEYGRLGYAPGEFYYPLAIAAAPDGRVFITQGYQGRVQVYRLFDTADVMAPARRR